MSVPRGAVPGVHFLLKLSLNIVLPLLVVRGAFSICGKYFSFDASRTFESACCGLMVALCIVTSTLWSTVCKKLKAASWRAIEVPSVKGNVLGNADFVYEWITSVKGASYIGKLIYFTSDVYSM